MVCQGDEGAVYSYLTPVADNRRTVAGLLYRCHCGEAPRLRLSGGERGVPQYDAVLRLCFMLPDPSLEAAMVVTRGQRFTLRHRF